MPNLDEIDQLQLDRVITLVREVLHTDAIAAYLFGSAVLGGLRPTSDLDVLVVSKRRTTREDKQRLVDRLLAISGQTISGEQGRSIELTIVVEGEIKPWHYPPSYDFQYGDWLRSEFEQGIFQQSLTVENPDLAALITMVILGNTPLFGPPPAEIFDPVPPGDLIRSMADAIDPLRADLHSDTRNVILTLARIWSTAATGMIRSKDAAADWELERLPVEHQRVLGRAREIYLGEHAEFWDDLTDQIEPHADFVITEIRRLTEDSAPLQAQ